VEEEKRPYSHVNVWIRKYREKEEEDAKKGEETPISTLFGV
jgi:hypothetical protein